MTTLNTASSRNEVQYLFDQWTLKEGYPYYHKHEYQQLISGSTNLKKPNQKVLDVGCGTGILASFVKSHGHHITGVDISPEAIKSALANRAIDEGLVCDIWEPSLPQNHYDVVICSSILMMIFDLPPFVKRVHQLLNKGGEFLIIDHHRRNPYEVLHFSRPNWVDYLLEGRSNIPRRALDEKMVMNSGKTLFQWTSINYPSLFTTHPNWKINLAHKVARGFFKTLRSVIKSPWTGNVITMVGKKVS